MGKHQFGTRMSFSKQDPILPLVHSMNLVAVLYALGTGSAKPRN